MLLGTGMYTGDMVFIAISWLILIALVIGVVYVITKFVSNRRNK